MSSYRTTPEDDRYYPSPIPSRAHQYQYENPTDMTYRQHPSRAPQPEPYYPLPPTGMRQRPPFPSSGYPMNAPQQQQQQQQQQGYGNYYTENAMQPQQTYPHPSAVPHQPSNYSQPLNTGDYYPHTNIPDRPPPAYDDVYSPDEGSPERAESVSPEEIHKAEEFVDAETLGWIPSRKPGRQQYMTRLEKPVVIPRIGVSGRMKAPMPFLRAYSPVLVEHDINEKEFLDFIDNLGVAQAGSPVFTAVNAAGQIIGLVPSHWAAIAAAGLQIAAGVGSAAVSKVRTQRFLAKSNEKYFNPRGLKVSLKMDEDLVNSLFADPGSPQAREYGRRLLAPNDLQGGYQDLRQRKMAVLQPYTAPLTERVLPPRNQDNILDKLSARGIEKQTRKAEKKYAKQQRKAEKKQMKLERLRVRGGMVNDDRYNPRNRAQDGRYGSDDSSDSDSSDNEMDKLNRRTAQMNLNQRMGDTQYGERSKHQRKYEKELAKANRKADRANAKDEKTAQRMEYIVVENL